jgi:hypothetical protein
LNQGGNAVVIRKYRLLEQECRFQAALTGHEQTRKELRQMEREYKALADALERQLLSEDQMPSKGAGAGGAERNSGPIHHAGHFLGRRRSAHPNDDC